MRTLLFLVLFAVFFFLASPGSAVGEGEDFYRAGAWRVLGHAEHYLDFGTGVFDFNGEDDSRNVGAARVELRGGRKLLFVGPAFGLLANFEGGYLAYGGLYADIAYGKIVFTPAFGAGYFERGESKDLGGNLQFRSSLSVSFQFEDHSRAGLQVSHVSNADLNRSNPGQEDLLFFLSIPFGF